MTNLVAHLTVAAAAWQPPGRTIPLIPACLVTCERDEPLAGSLAACLHLNDRHRDLASTLAGQPGYFAELHSAGVTLGIEGADGEYPRVAWPGPCETLDEVFALLRTVCPGQVVPSVS